MRIGSSAPPRSSDLRLRGALLMPLCALAVHQLRYYLAFGSHGAAALGRDGHAYLASLQPFVLLAAALAVGGLAGGIARAWQAPDPVTASSRKREHSLGRRSRPLAIWALCAAILLGLYCGQELCEGLLAPGHPAGAAGVLGHGGWIAVPTALLLAAALAAALRATEALVARIARAAGTRRHRSATPGLPLRRASAAARNWRLEPQSGLIAGRAPPLAPSLT